MWEVRRIGRGHKPGLGRNQETTAEELGKQCTCGREIPHKSQVAVSDVSQPAGAFFRPSAAQRLTGIEPTGGSAGAPVVRNFQR